MVSVIIPARNAADTLPDTIRSLEDQTFSKWEAIVVENSSTDDTAIVAERFCARDARVRVLRHPGGGASAARNAGLREARFDWVLFLDADDRIQPTYLEKMTGALRGDPLLDGVYCGFTRETERGLPGGSDLHEDDKDLFRVFARCCAWSIHCVVARKALVQEVGGFPEDLVTCEDWLLWQRLFRAGARFARVPELLAVYRIRPASASQDGLRMARDTIRVVGIGHGPDPAVRSPRPEHARGLPETEVGAARLAALAWPAALLVGHSEDGRRVLDLVPGDRDPNFSPEILAYTLFHAARLTRSLPENAWIDLWPEVGGRVRELLDAYEKHTGAPHLARRAMRILESIVLSTTDENRSLTFGSLRKVGIELSEKIPELAAGPGVERVDCALAFMGRPVGSVHLPVCDGIVPSAVLADAVASEDAYSLLRLYWEELDRGRFRPGRSFLFKIARRAARAAGSLLGNRRRDFEEWALATIDEFALSSEMDFGKDSGPPIRVAREAIPRVELCAPIPNLEVEGGETDIVLAFAGRAIGKVRVRADRGIVRASELRRAAIEACGLDLFCLVVRESVLERSLRDGVPLRERLREKLERTQAENRSGEAAGSDPAREAALYGFRPEGTVLFARRDPLAVGTSASRRAAFPANAVPDLLETARALGEASFVPPESAEEPCRALYVPEWIAPVKTRSARPFACPDPRRVRARNTAVRFIQRAFPTARRALGKHAIADRLPILLYHRIAEDGPAELARYRVSPAAFEEQMRHLLDRGYRAIDLDEWAEARTRRRQIRGRAVLITFDDGYEDFARNAWPILRAAGFRATVFLVANLVGKRAVWDDSVGEGAPLLGEDAVRALQEEGVLFGSHAMNHVPLTALSPEEIVREGTQSRRELARLLGEPPRAFAYPFGDEGALVRHLIGASGYVYGLTCDHAHARYSHPLLALPRLEVEGSFTIERFARLIETREKGI